MEITYENIKPLIVSEEDDGMMIKIKFQAEGQATPLETIAVVTPDIDEIKKNAMKAAAVSTGASMGLNAATSALGRVLGGIGGTLARRAGRVASSAVAANAMNPSKLMNSGDPAKREAAIVLAFTAFAPYYRWENDKWIYQTPQG